MLRAIAVLLVASAGAAAPVPKGIKEKVPDLSGKWEIAEMKSGDLDITHLNPWVWEIDGEKLTIYVREGGKLKPNELITVTILVRPEGGGGADEVDYIRDDGKTPQRFPGRIELKENELTFSFADPGQPRPAEAKAGSRYYYYHFKRMTDK